MGVEELDSEGMLAVVRPWRKCGASWPERAIRRRVVRRAWPVSGGAEVVVRDR